MLDGVKVITPYSFSELCRSSKMKATSFATIILLNWRTVIFFVSIFIDFLVSMRHIKIDTGVTVA